MATHFIGIINDVTERLRNEQALAKSEESFRTLVANIPGIVYRCELRTTHSQCPNSGDQIIFGNYLLGVRWL